MFINYERYLKSSRQFRPPVWNERHAKFPAQDILSDMQKKKRGVPFRLPIPRVRDIITGSVKLPGHRSRLPDKVIFVSHKPYED